MALTTPQRSSFGNHRLSPRRRGVARNSAAILIGVIVLVLAGGIGWFYFHSQNGPQPPNGVQPEESAQKIEATRAAELLRKARVANAYLEDENEDVGVDAAGKKLNGYLEAEKRLAELHKELPEESLPLRNLVISRLLYLQKNQLSLSAAEQAARQDQIRGNLEALKRIEPESAIPCLLSASFLETLSVTLSATNAAEKQLLEDLRQQSLDELRAAQRLDPGNLTAQWLLHEKALAEGLKTENTAALKNLYRLAPNNIEVLKNYFVVLAQDKDPELVKVLQNAQALIFAAGEMKAAELPPAQKPGENALDKMLKDAIAAAEAEDWPKATYAVTMLGNLLRGMAIQRSDYSRLSQNLLDFMQHDFSTKFYARIEKSSSEAKLTSQPLAELFPEKTGAISPLPLIAFQTVDFNNDLEVDIVGLVGGDTKNSPACKLVVLGRNSGGKEWATLLEQDLPGVYHGILCADLDRDARAMEDDAWKTKIEKLAGAANRVNFTKENPADPDLIVFGPAGLKVFLNEDGLQEVKQNSDIASLKNVTAAVLIDIEADADLDLVLACESGVKILLNPGNRRFVDFSSPSILPAEKTKVASLAIADWDRDVDVDVLVGDEGGNTIGVLENMLHGIFRWQPFGQDFQDFQSGRGLHVVECDGNVSWDLIGAGAREIQVCLTDTVRSHVSPRRTHSFGDREYRGLVCADLDNDSYLDVIAWDDSQLNFFQGAAEGAFQISDFQVADLDDVRQCLADDLDYDGDLDLIVSTASGIQIFENGCRENGWLTLLPIGIEDNQTRANHNGIGSLVEVIANGRYQAQTITSERIHFGLNGARNADVLRIVWTNGMPQTVIEPRANLVIREMMFEKGSCPFIYVWNGSEFVFFSDCLWAAPIGLRGADGNAAPTREWEYLKIPGDKLKAENGVYRIQLTEELWEAAYFDSLELIAVDHPQEADIFTNEKVGPPSIAEHKIFTVANKQLPISARDKSGRDVLAEIAAEDGRFMQGFEKRLYKGFTPMHYLELDLGAWQDPQQITLFLTGWIRPTDSSLNVGFSQNPQVAGPVGPQVWVPDADGQWQLRIAPMGFPGGKTKTISVDLSEAFLTDDYRLRVQTSAEIYWDHVFFAVDESSYPLEIHHLSVAAADLHFRGFSHRFYADEKSPEWYDYQKLSTTPRWPPMRGNFTRYGDVRELLSGSDDRLVVLGSGDEMTVEFRAPNSGPPEGWRRDFILHSVGYDKDADLNTFEGQSSEPLPFRAMSGYPFTPGESAPNSAAYQAYLQKYQTRRQSWRRFWKLLTSDSARDTKTD